MWPMVPIIHMYYRMTQLGRAFALNAAMSGPSYIFIVLVCLDIAFCLKASLTLTERSLSPSLHACTLLPSCHIDISQGAPLLTTLRASQLISLLPPTSRCIAYSLSSPKGISALQALLAFVWVFNIAAVIVWMPWLYCWQYQPTKE